MCVRLSEEGGPQQKQEKRRSARIRFVLVGWVYYCASVRASHDNASLGLGGLADSGRRRGDSRRTGCWPLPAVRTTTAAAAGAPFWSKGPIARYASQQGTLSPPTHPAAASTLEPRRPTAPTLDRIASTGTTCASHHVGDGALAVLGDACYHASGDLRDSGGTTSLTPGASAPSSPMFLAPLCAVQRWELETMDNIHSLDPRKQELLEARFLGNRQLCNSLGPGPYLSQVAVSSQSSSGGGGGGVSVAAAVGAGGVALGLGSVPPSQLLGHVSSSGSSNNTNHNQDSNMSNASLGSQHSDKELETPEKHHRTPPQTERKRKRKEDPASTAAKGARGGENPKKMNEYYKGSSPLVSPLTSALNSMDYAGLMAPPQRPVQAMTRQVQTDLTINKIKELESKSAMDLEMRDNRIDELQRGSEELRRQIQAQQKVIQKQEEQLLKCIDVTKQLLIEKSAMEKKQSRQRCMQNRLRLGQFVTQRQGASFVENWVDGYAFNELLRKQEQITSEREEIERQRKLLCKKKPNTGQPKGKAAANNGAAALANGEFVKPESPKE